MSDTIPACIEANPDHCFVIIDLQTKKISLFGNVESLEDLAGLSSVIDAVLEAVSQ